MKILLACECSGIGKAEFEKLGHDVWSCDILPGVNPQKHYQGNVLDILDWGWDMMIACPPCTYLCNSGVRWLYLADGISLNVERWQKMEDAAKFFKKLLTCKIPKIAIENSIPHRYAMEIINKPYTQIIHPWQHGHGETKATCLWLKGLKPIEPTNIVEGRTPRIHKMPGGKNQGKMRGTTYPGIAKAWAKAWGK